MSYLRSILIGATVLAGSFFISLKAMDWVWPPRVQKPVLAVLPALPPVARRSEIVAPVRIPLTVIAASLDRAAPRSFEGKADNPVGQILKDAVINWTVTRGNISANGAQNSLMVSTPLEGKVTVLGSLQTAAAPVANAITSLFGSQTAEKIGNVAIKSLNASAAIHGNAQMTARPLLVKDWHVDPQLTAQVDVGNTNLSVAGAKVAVPAQVKPVLDKTINDEVGRLQQRLRNDGSFRQNAQRQWAKLCRTVALPAVPGTPQLFLEMRPVNAMAAQPQIDNSAVKLAIGLQAETHIVNAQTTPQCPFPDTLNIVPSLNEGRVNVGVPIDMSFDEVSRIVEAQLKGRTFPEDGNGAFEAIVESASVDADGDRLLISLLVNAHETKSWFGFGAEATVRIWGRPVLDQNTQILRFTDLSVAVESGGAFGLLNAAAHTATPYLQKALQDHAAIDLKALASGAQQKLASVITGLQTNENGIKVDANVTSVRLGEIAFDSNTLRVIAEATGTMNVIVNQLPALN